MSGSKKFLGTTEAWASGRLLSGAAPQKIPALVEVAG